MAKGNFLYMKLYNQLREGIENGVYPPGAKMPAEADLRQQFGVSTITVKKAYNMLAEEGYVRRVPGKGTFAKGVKPAPEIIPPRCGGRLIGMVLEHVSTPFGLEMLYTMDNLLRERGYKLCVRYSYADRVRETEEIEFLLSLGVAGLIIMPCHGSFYSTTILHLIVDAFPVVLIDKKLEGLPVPSVRTDNEDAAARLTEHLYARGCRRIGLFSFDGSDATSLMERIEGCRRQLEAMGLEEGPSCFVRSKRQVINNEPDAAIVDQVSSFLRGEGSALDGLICTEFGMVPCLVAAAEREGVVLGPEGLRVCCVDEDYLAPGGFTFTHVKQDERVIADRAVEMLKCFLDSGEPALADCLVPGLFFQGRTT